jgi:hypothetical protein
MNVIDFLCVSLGSSTAQLHDGLGIGSECTFQKLISVVKMAIVLQECITEEQRSVVHFLWAKVLTAKDIHK